MKAERFEDLKIGQQARELVAQIYFSFGEKSRAGQDHGFRNQVTRASMSVMNNIAEGFERSTDRDFAHFLTIAKASAGEVRSMLYAAEDLFYIEVPEAENLRASYEELSRGISKLASYLRN